MLEVNFRDADTLLSMGANDAKAAEAVLLELLAQISLACGTSKLRWKLYQAQPGSNSFSLHGPGQVQFHFRASTRRRRHQGLRPAEPGQAGRDAQRAATRRATS